MKLKKKLSDTVGSLVQIRPAANSDQLIVFSFADPMIVSGSAGQWIVFGSRVRKEVNEMQSIKELEKEIEQIKERNFRVESDKAWETSKTRKVIISIATYIIIGLFLSVARIPDPWLSAIIPSLAFILSTLSLPMFKDLWIKYVYKK